MASQRQSPKLDDVGEIQKNWHIFGGMVFEIDDCAMLKVSMSTVTWRCPCSMCTCGHFHVSICLLAICMLIFGLEVGMAIDLRILVCL